MNRRSALALLAGSLASARVSADGSSLEDVLLVDVGAKRYTVSTTEKPVEDVLADVGFSIAEFNYRLTGTNSVGYAIADRDDSAAKRVARVFHFCNIQIAEQLLAAGDEYLMHMPCRLVVWEAQQAVWVASRLLTEAGPADKELVAKINHMMREIADFAISE